MDDMRMLKHADAAVVAAEQQQKHKRRICPDTSHDFSGGKDRKNVKNTKTVDNICYIALGVMC
jgi:hypothetical protein